MGSIFNSKSVVSSVALAMLAGAALASQSAGETPAYGDALLTLTTAGAGNHAVALFDRADMDRDGRLNADEYGALSIVTAELARLNGFAPVLVEGEVVKVILPFVKAPALTPLERARVGAIAVRDFHMAAGADAAITRDEFVGEMLERFRSADRNRNGVLNQAELGAFGASAARLPQSLA